MLAPRPVWQLALSADIAATFAVFAFSAAFRNSSFYDAYWSVAPPVIFAYWFVTATPDGVENLWASVGAGAVIAWWAIRLTGNWARGWNGLQHEDWRYVALQTQLGAWYWPVSLLGIHLFPTLVVFVGCLPLLVVFEGQDANPFIAGIALVVGLASVWLERRADNELHAFRRLDHPPDTILKTGVWRWCRHPNYLGELGFWLSIALFAAATTPSATWIWISPATVLALFLVVSIPMIERRLADKRGYDTHRSASFALLPFSHYVWKPAS